MKKLRLVDLEPEWIDAEGRTGLGVRFRCLTGCCTGFLWILFDNPLDGGPAYERDCLQLFKARRAAGYNPVADRPCGMVRWTRTGETFQTLSLSPSVNAHHCGHMWLKNGVFQ